MTALLRANIELHEIHGLAVREFADAEARQRVVEHLEAALGINAPRHVHAVRKAFSDLGHRYTRAERERNGSEASICNSTRTAFWRSSQNIPEHMTPFDRML